jgi:hypothetical protein
MNSNEQFPTPVKYGRISPGVRRKTISYDGSFISFVLYQNKKNPRQIHQFLAYNRVGSVFDDLKQGQQLFIPEEPNAVFMKHPEA